MEFEQIMQIIDKVNNSNISEVNVEEGNFKISIKSKESEKVYVSQQSVVTQEVAQTTENVTVNEVNVSEGTDIVCPLVGTFYSAKSETEEPFVKVGDRVSKGQVIGIVEAMKLMNEITATADGVITEILVNNEDLVEYGQVIMKVK